MTGSCGLFGLKHEMSVLITYAQIPLIKAHTDVSNNSNIEDLNECSCFIEFIKQVGEKR